MSNIAELIKQLAGQNDEFSEIYAVPCTVKSYDGSAKTCVCSPSNGDADLIDVRLQADDGNSFYVVPRVGSAVMVQPINNMTGFIVMFSQVESIQFLDGSFGGLTKTQELKTQLDKTNEVINAIVNSLQNWTPVSNDGGAALKTYFATQISGKTIGDYSGIENGKITHGDI